MPESYAKVHRTWPNGTTDEFELNRLTEPFWSWECVQVRAVSKEPHMFHAPYSNLVWLSSASVSEGTLYLKYEDYHE